MGSARDTCAPELTRNLWGKNFRKLPKTTITYTMGFIQKKIYLTETSLELPISQKVFFQKLQRHNYTYTCVTNTGGILHFL